MSVARSQLFVRIGTDNKIEKLEPALYRKSYAVVVTDSTGNAVKDAAVIVNLRPLQYRTGYWEEAQGGPPEWKQKIIGTFPSEDVDRDGICKAGEDTNDDKQLTPGNVASTAPTVSTTENGTAAVTLVFPRSFAQWVEVLLDVRVQVAGSEGAAVAQFWLPIAADDLGDKAVAPPGALSPFPFQKGPDFPTTCP
jgi:hypothetical protein